MQVAGVVIARLRPPGFDGLGKFGAVRTEIAGQGLEERQPSGGIQIMVAVEHLARHRGPGCLAAAREQGLA